jgi:hypothetical protein
MAAWADARSETPPKGMSSTVRESEPAHLSSSVGSWRGTLPYARPVRIVEHIGVEGQNTPQDGVWAGQYDPATGEIRIIRTAGDLTLAHEYGHALLQDLIIKYARESVCPVGTFQSLSETNRSTDPSQVPEWLRTVFADYRSLPADPYGSAYYGSTFNEYFAESFARIANRDGKGVAAATTAFFANLECALLQERECAAR